MSIMFYVDLYNLCIYCLIELWFKTRRYVYLQSDFDIRFLKISPIYPWYIPIPDKFSWSLWPPFRTLVAATYRVACRQGHNFLLLWGPRKSCTKVENISGSAFSLILISPLVAIRITNQCCIFAISIKKTIVHSAFNIPDNFLAASQCDSFGSSIYLLTSPTALTVSGLLIVQYPKLPTKLLYWVDWTTLPSPFDSLRPITADVFTWLQLSILIFFSISLAYFSEIRKFHQLLDILGCQENRT